MSGNSVLSQTQRIELAKAGRTVVANKREGCDMKLIAWAMSQCLIVVVDRTTKWGNPFIPKNPSNPTPIERDRVISEYRTWLQQQSRLLADIDSLKGKVLACWCYDKPCHADILAALANGHELPYGQPAYAAMPRQQSLF